MGLIHFAWGFLLLIVISILCLVIVTFTRQSDFYNSTISQIQQLHAKTTRLEDQLKDSERPINETKNYIQDLVRDPYHMINLGNTAKVELDKLALKYDNPTVSKLNRDYTSIVDYGNYPERFERFRTKSDICQQFDIVEEKYRPFYRDIIQEYSRFLNIQLDWSVLLRLESIGNVEKTSPDELSVETLRYVTVALMVVSQLKRKPFPILEIDGAYGMLCVCILYTASLCSVNIPSYTILTVTPLIPLQEFFFEKAADVLSLLSDTKIDWQSVEDPLFREKLCNSLYLVNILTYSWLSMQDQQVYNVFLRGKIEGGWMLFDTRQNTANLKDFCSMIGKIEAEVKIVQKYPVTDTGTLVYIF